MVKDFFSISKSGKFILFLFKYFQSDDETSTSKIEINCGYIVLIIYVMYLLKYFFINSWLYNFNKSDSFKKYINLYIHITCISIKLNNLFIHY